MNEPFIIGWCGPTNGYWQWTLEHFSDVRLLNNSELATWLEPAQSISGASRVLFTAIESRSDDHLKSLESIAKSAIGESSETAIQYAEILSSCCVLLGADWAGHRRTAPLPDNLRSHYWYELHDRTLPWVLHRKQIANKKSKPNKSTSGNTTKDSRRLNPRVARMLADLEDSRSLNQQHARSLSDALVVTNSVSIRQSWVETFAGLGIKATATTPDNLKLWAAPELIVVDLTELPLSASDSHQSTEQLLRRLSQQFSDAMLVVSMAFPRWDTWQRFREAGADALVGKPGNIAGLMNTWQQWAATATTNSVS